jgi:hypothetical protein
MTSNGSGTISWELHSWEALWTHLRPRRRPEKDVITHTEEKFKNDSAQTLRHVGERCLEKTGKVLVAFDGDGYIIVNLGLFQAWLPNDGVEGGGVVCCSPWHQLQLLQPLQNRRERRKSATSGDAAAGGLKFPEAQPRRQPRL